MNNNNATQSDKVLDYIKRNGSITNNDAFYHLGITRLANCIWELRKKDVAIESITETAENRFSEKVSYSRYYLTE